MRQSFASFLARIAQSESSPPWGAFEAAATIALAFAALVIGLIAASVWLGDSPLAVTIGWALGNAVTAAYLLLRARRSSVYWQALRLGTSSLPLLFVLLLGLGLAIAIDVLSLALTGQSLPLSELMVTARDWLAAAVLLVLAQPLAEELVFRGMLFPLARVRMGVWPGLLIPALASATFHLLAYPPTYLSATDFSRAWYGFAVPLLAGLVATLIRAYAGSTWAAVVAHAAFGLFAVLKILALNP